MVAKEPVEHFGTSGAEAGHSRTVNSAVLRFALLFIVLLGAEWTTGAFSASFGRFPDAAAHYVSTLAVREYLLHGFPGDPLEFSVLYYAHYPKVAIGHWPPLFYSLAALWTLVFGVSKGAVFSLYALLGASFAETLWRAARTQATLHKPGRDWEGRTVAAAVALSGILVLFLRGYGTSVMLELPVALFVLWSLLAFARFMEAPSARNSIFFGLLASVAILTKGNAAFLALLPPVALLLAGKMRLLLRWQIWLSAGTVALLAVPWLFYARELTVNSFSQAGILSYMGPAAIAYPRLLVEGSGWLLSLLALLAILSVAWQATAGRSREPQLGGTGSSFATGQAMAASVLAFFLFHIATPSGWEDRYWFTVLGPLSLLAGMGIRVLSGRVEKRYPVHTNRGLPTAGTAALLLLCILVPTELVWRFGAQAPKPDSAMGKLAERLTRDASLNDARVLVCCDAIAEGALIAEVAMRRPMPPRDFYLLRATKQLVRLRWSGYPIGVLLDGPGELEAYLHDTPVDVVVYAGDSSPATPDSLSRLLGVVSARPERWTRDDALSGPWTGSWSERSTQVFFQRGSLDRPRSRISISPFQ